jgi:AcrR family transcriptional regulator
LKKKSPARGRPLEFVEEQVLRKSMMTFWELGYDDVSMDKLCKVSELSKPSFYNTFGSKEDLFLRCLEMYQVDYASSLLDSMLNETNPLKGFRNILESLSERLKDPKFPSGCLIITGALGAKGKSKRIDKRLVELQQGMLQRIQTYFHERAPGEDAGHLSSFVVSQLFALLLLTKSGHQSEVVKTFMDHSEKTLKLLLHSRNS